MTDRNPSSTDGPLVPPEQGDDVTTGRASVPEWQLWPPGSKMQIAMIAAMFALFNLILIVIVAIIVVRNL